MGRADEAIPVLEQVAVDSERILGPAHLETLTARAYLALSYRDVGHTGEAIAILEQIAPQSESFLRPYHRHGTIDRIAEMAPLYATAGRTEEAIAAAEWGVADRERSCGPADPLTRAARALLADLYRTAGRADSGRRAGTGEDQRSRWFP